MAKRKDNAAQMRLAIGIGTVTVVVLVIGFGLFYSGAEGPPYATLDRPAASETAGEVKVVEFFSYTCPHCRNFDEIVDGWREDLPDGVVLERVHVAYSPENRLLARAHLALVRHGALAANHQRIFSAIHDRNKRFDSPATLADFIDGNGVDREAFLRTMTSTRITRRVEAAEAAFIDLGLLSVPALVVDDKYVINMDLGRKGALDAVDDLLAELRDPAAA